jgi:hypothetical protein
MAERSRSENGPVSPEERVNRALSNIEIRDAVSDPRGTAGFKEYAVKGGKIIGATSAGLLFLAGAVVLKTIEYSARFLQGVVENPDKPSKWLDPIKAAAKGKKEKK